MKKLLLFVFMLPLAGFSQVDLATWALTSNANPTTVNTYATASGSVGSGVTASYSAAGLSAYGFSETNVLSAAFDGDTYSFTIAPKAGEDLYISTLQLTHRVFGNGNGVNKAPANYTITYYKSTDPFGTLTSLVQGAATSASGITNNLAIDQYIAAGESLVISMHAWNGGTSSSARWQIDANTLKITGFARLCGDYIIANSSVAPFKTLASAVTAVNTLGVSCAVRYMVDENQTTTSNYVINQFLGTSTTNTLTIRPNTGDNITIQVNNVDGNSTTNSAFALNGADNIIFDGNNGSSNNMLRIYRNNTNGNLTHSVMLLYGGATGNTIKNLTLQATTNLSNAPSYGVSAGGSTVASAGDNTTNTIDNVTFTSTFYPVIVNGSSASSNSNWSVMNSTINSGTGARYGFNIINSNSAIVSGNTIDPITNTTDISMYAAINVSGNNVSVTGNTIRNINYNSNNGTTRYGIGVTGTTAIITNNIISTLSTQNNDIYATYVSGSGATVAFNTISSVTASGSDRIGAGVYINGTSATIYNNMINEVRLPSANNQGGGHGIYLAGNSTKVFFNTIRVATNQGSGRSSCLYIHSGTSLEVRNNIFVNLQTSPSSRYTVYCNVNSPFGGGISNNVHYSTASNIGYFNGSARTYAQWVSNAGDTSSLNYNPVFTSTSDLHINALDATNISTLDAKGTPVAGITTDIDAEVRNTTTPDIGADEWGSICSGSTTWNGSSWSNSAPTSSRSAIITGTYNTGTNGNIVACELTVNANAVLTIASGGSVKVENGITTAGAGPNQGSIVVQNSGNLIQVDNAASASSPGTNVTVIRTSTPLKQYDYTYWSAPVEGATLSTVSAPSLYYEWNPSVGTTGQWTNLSWAYVMLPASGYIARAPNDLIWANNPTVTATFKGKANSGNISKTVYKNGSSSSNLVGNPYPSSLSADAFMIANAANITGPLYFWTHATAIAGQQGSSIQNYSSNDYATYTLMGSTGTSGNIVNGSENVAKRPTGQIASGQAFFIDAVNNNVNLVFTNAMRTGGANNQFFRAAQENTTHSGMPEKSRVWITLTNDEGAYAETLVGYAEGATNEMDNLFDAVKYDGGNFVSLYSVHGENNLVIQGRALPFTDEDIVPLGYNTTIAGTFKITLDEFDGLFEGKDVYLLDKLTETTVKLNDGAYTFTSEIGTFNSRFELRYTNVTLGIEDPIAANAVVVFTKGKQIEVNSGIEQIQSITVFDLLGRTIYAKDKIDAKEFATNGLTLPSQVVIVKVKMANNSEVTKKVILK